MFRLKKSSSGLAKNHEVLYNVSVRILGSQMANEFLILIDMNFLSQMIKCYYIRSENICSIFWFYC